MNAGACRICGHTKDLRSYEAQERMFGLGHAFRYFQCGACDCLQIAQVPEDMSPYYPSGYYAHQQERPKTGALRRVLRGERNRYALSRRGLLGRLLQRLSPYPHGEAYRWLQHRGITRDSRILDVGCGTGRLLLDLHEQGYRHLLGVDPFVDADTRLPGGVAILKARLPELSGSFDLIMFHHAFEHIPDPQETLQAVERLLAPGGLAVIRIPVVPSYAWEHYREEWVQLDAPRHFFLHSPASMRLLSERAGLRLEEIRYDSTEFQFVGSEMYRRGVPLIRWPDDAFTRRQIREFRRRARALNEQGRGDSAIFFLRKPARGADAGG